MRFYVRLEGAAYNESVKQRWTIEFFPAAIGALPYPQNTGKIGRTRTFRSDQSIRAFVARTPTQRNYHYDQRLTAALQRGEGYAWLDVTEAQFTLIGRA